MNETRLEQDLQALARGIDVPVSPAEEDLGRGRGRLRRRRLTVAGVVVAVVAVVGVGVVVTPGLTDDGVDPVGPPSQVRDVAPGQGSSRSVPGHLSHYGPALERWRLVLAEHLDPDLEHLERWRADQGNATGQQDEDGLHVLSAYYPWRSGPGEGRSSIQLWMGDDPEEQQCGAGCRELDAAPGVRAAWVVRDQDQGSVSVTAVREDGDVVTVSFQPWHPTAPLGDFDRATPPEEEALLAAASDSRLTLEGEERPLPAVYDGVLEKGRELVVERGERLEAADAGPGWVLAEWSHGESSSRLSWIVAARYDDDEPALADLCAAGRHRSCEIRDYDGRSVLVTEPVPESGGPVEIVHRGPDAWVVLEVGPEPEGPERFPLDRGIAFVLDERWQSAG